MAITKTKKRRNTAPAAAHASTAADFFKARFGWRPSTRVFHTTAKRGCGGCRRVLPGARFSVPVTRQTRSQQVHGVQPTSLLIRGSDVVTVYPEELVIDRDGNKRSKASAVGVVCRAVVHRSVVRNDALVVCEEVVPLKHD